MLSWSSCSVYWIDYRLGSEVIDPLSPYRIRSLLKCSPGGSLIHTRRMRLLHRFLRKIQTKIPSFKTCYNLKLICLLILWSNINLTHLVWFSFSKKQWINQNHQGNDYFNAWKMSMSKAVMFFPWFFLPAGSLWA